MFEDFEIRGGFGFHQWIWPCAIVFVLLMPLLFWRGHRRGYLATVGCLLSLAFAALWVIDYKAADEMTVITYSKGPKPAQAIDTTYRIISHRGGLLLELVKRIIPDFTRHSLATQPAELGRIRVNNPPFKVSGYPELFLGDRDKRTGYGFNRWGFQLFVDNTQGGEFIRILGVVIPDWFMIVVFLMPLAFWIYHRKWGIARYRRRRNLCTQCAYNLAGTPTSADGTRCCSECGTINPAQNRIDAPRTFTPTPPV